MIGGGLQRALCLAVGVPAALAYTATIDNSTAPNPQNVCSGYKARDVTNTTTGMTAELHLAGPACNVFGDDISILELSVEYQDTHRLLVNIEPKSMGSKESWYVLPDGIVPLPSGSSSMPQTDMEFQWGNTPNFWFEVQRQSTKEVIFSTRNTQIVFENQFIEFITQLPENYNISGLGEHIHGLRLQPGLVATNWDADVQDPVDRNMYGTHPFYIEQRYKQPHGPNGPTTSQSHGVFFRNSHGLEAILGNDTLTWRAIGGSIQLYFMDGPTPADVTAQFVGGVTGLPAMQQYWTFGFHQCHWGYANWSEVQNNIDQYRAVDVPLETQWVDINYMDAYWDFTLDPVNFPQVEGEDLIAKLHEDGQHFVPIIDSGVYYPNGDKTPADYPTYERGTDLGIFVHNEDGSQYVGSCWPGFAVWPDWLNPQAEGWWSNEVSLFHKKLNFDGIWNDMNEPSSFCTGSCFGNSAPQSGPIPKGGRDVNNPPYAINNVQGTLNTNTMATNATQYGGVQHYDVHNIYGAGLLRASNAGMQQVFPGKRPFILGRSTFTGSGQVAAHWGGDNTATWQYMYWAIPQALTMSLFGIPMFGPDTCGFLGTSTQELCGRWMQQSAFFPFYRNHYATGLEGREAWRWPSVAEWSRETMKIRYSMVPYIYTLFQAAHTTGSTVMRALSWEFPNDATLFGADRQFMLGPALMVVPVLNEGATTVDGVFPGQEPWYDWYSQTQMPRTSANVTIDAPQGHIPLYVLGGNVMPLQQPAYTLEAARKNPWSVLVALDSLGQAQGSLYLDDGASITPSETQMVDFVAQPTSLKVSMTGSYTEKTVTPLSNVTVMGVSTFRGFATFNGARLPTKDVSYDKDEELLQITGLHSMTAKGVWKSAWELEW